METEPKATLTLLTSNNFQDAAKYYREYRDIKSPNQNELEIQIPKFYEPEDELNLQKGKQNEKVKNIFKLIENLKFKKDISSLILQPKDIQYIKSIVLSEESKLVLFDSIKWDELRKNPTLGKSYYLSEEFLSAFKIEKSKYYQSHVKKYVAFKSVEYIDCLLLNSRLFYAYSFFEEINPNVFYDFNSFVSEDTISSFVEIMIPHLNSLKNLGKMKDYYIPYATTLIMTFLTFYEKEKIPLKKLLFSKIFIKFINIDYDDLIKKDKPKISSNSNPIADDGFPNFSNSSSNVIRRQNNPFKQNESKIIYNKFIKMDSKKTGYLRMEDIKKTDNYLFTDAFLDRLFHNVLTETSYNEDRFDYILFLRFYISLNYMKTPRSVDLFFEVADIDGDGVISNFDILYFYKEMIKETKIDKEKHSYDRFYSELLDITKCNAKDGITKKQIYQNKVGYPFFLLLFDISTFMEWEGPYQE